MKEKSTLRKILRLYEPHKSMTITVLFGAALSSIISTTWPIITKMIMEDCIGQPWSKAEDPLYRYLMILIALTLGNIIAQYILTYDASVLTDKIKYGLSMQIFYKYQNMGNGYYDNARTGGIISMIDYDIDKVDQFIYNLMTSIIRLIFTTIGAVIVLTTMGPWLVVMIIPLLILVVLVNNVQDKKVSRSFQELRKMNKTFMEDAEDKISGVRTVISFGNEDEEVYRYNSNIAEIMDKSKNVWKQTFTRNAIISSFDNVLYLIIIVAGTYMTIRGLLNVSDLMVFFLYSYMISEPVKNLSDISRMYVKAKSSYEHIDQFLHEEPFIKNPRSRMVKTMNGEIEFSNVFFKYMEEQNEDVITDLSMKIKPGKMTAIVGPSGSGKSTIAGLIPRYYEVDRGTIKIDGVNVKDYDLKHLRKSIGVVQQDIYLFFGTIYDNIKYACPEASMEEVINAAKLANADEFISELPNGYNSNIGDRGVKLSGGQKQRIAIARIFLENPPIIIFDEATSALDNESEKEVQKAMENLSKMRTTIVIAHRLTTIQNADEILYLSKNGIEERGTHEELMVQDGLYSKLYKSSIK